MNNHPKSKYDVQDTSTPESRAKLNPLKTMTVNVEEGFGITINSIGKRMHESILDMFFDPVKVQLGGFTLTDIGKAVEEKFTYRELTYIVAQGILDHAMTCDCPAHRQIQKMLQVEKGKSAEKAMTDVKPKGNA